MAAGGRPSNGMAVTALVLGIVALVLFFSCGVGVVVGVLAIIFGVLGRGRAKQLGAGAGMALAGLILGVLGVLAGVGFIVAVVAASDDLGDRIEDAFDTADPDDYELHTDTCVVDRFGTVTFTGTIENTADRDLDFTIEGEITTSSGTLLDSPATYVSVPEGRSVAWEMTGSADEETTVRCTVTSVDDFFNWD